MNKVLITGRITRDPEIRYTQSGMSSLRFSVAVDRNVARDANGNRQADFINCVAFSQQADFISRYVHKGNMLCIEGRIQTIEKMLEHVSIITKQDTDKVSLGTTVSIKYVDEDDEDDEYEIVGSQEADPFESKISNESPIAQALLDHKVGDIVTVESPNGSYQVEITAIS